MDLRLLDYELPDGLIARYPTPERDGARLLVVEPEGPFARKQIVDLPELIAPGSLLVVNDTRVQKARLLGLRPTGGRIEIFVVERLAQPTAGRLEVRALVRSSKPVRPGQRCELEGGIVARFESERGSDGLLTVMLECDADIEAAIEAFGHVPLPPYLGRGDEQDDAARYQTVFAKSPGAVAAPTAGLHLSERLLARMAEHGIELATVTLHVSLGTFAPVKVADLDDHPMHEEVFEVPQKTSAQIDAARERGAPIVAVGTTVVRALESAAGADEAGGVPPTSGRTRILIQPGYRFRVVDQLLTNFHLPKSTLLALVAAFAGRERVLSAYQHAIDNGYRFYSYGDAMLLRRGASRS